MNLRNIAHFGSEFHHNTDYKLLHYWRIFKPKWGSEGPHKMKPQQNLQADHSYSRVSKGKQRETQPKHKN